MSSMRETGEPSRTRPLPTSAGETPIANVLDITDSATTSLSLEQVIRAAADL
jgi:hypothetical protein